MKLFITGINGFIGSHLTDHILSGTNWKVAGVDINDGRISKMLSHPRLRFMRGDVTRDFSLIEKEVAEADVILPLAAIATPKSYVNDTLRVFEVDFEATLKTVRLCAKHQKRLVFPSTSEVYGMCKDASFVEDESDCVVGPIQKSRWIYSCSKQLLDRVIWAYGEEGLEFTIFRPFNWIGPNQDDIFDQTGTSRVISQFIGNALRGEPMRLVDGGDQLRTFLDIRDGIKALLLILSNREASRSRIFNIGNPTNEYSIRELAQIISEAIRPHLLERNIKFAETVVDTPHEKFYGEGYQDVPRRVPSISNIESALAWSPTIPLVESINAILAHHFQKRFKAAS